MKKCSKCGIEKELNKFHKHRDNIDKLRTSCKSCRKIEKKLYMLKNKNKIKETNRLYRLNNLEKIKQNTKKWSENNPDKIRTYSIKRYALKKSALSPDRNDKIIEVFYEQVNRLSKCLGISFEVDHIIPISKSGQHHENNLQVIPTIFNRQKNNSLDYKCPYPTFKTTST